MKINRKYLCFQCASSRVFESINSIIVRNAIPHSLPDIVRKAIPHVYDTITEKILTQFVYLVSTSLRVTYYLPLVKYSPVTLFGNARATFSLLRACTYILLL